MMNPQIGDTCYVLTRKHMLYVSPLAIKYMHKVKVVTFARWQHILKIFTHSTMTSEHTPRAIGEKLGI